MTKHYDLLAIGAGSGGLSAPERAARYGARCAVVEARQLGGTCVNRGCVPKKVMWFAANMAHALHMAPDYGFDLERQGFDWARLKAARQAYIQGINDWYRTYLADSAIDLIEGHARFVDAHTIEVEGERYSADHIVIAPGGAPIVLDVPGQTASARMGSSSWRLARGALRSSAVAISQWSSPGCSMRSAAR